MLFLHTIISFFFGRKAHIAMWDVSYDDDTPGKNIRRKRTFTVKAVSRKLAAKRAFRKHGLNADRYASWGNSGPIYTDEVLVDWYRYFRSPAPRYWVYQTRNPGSKTLKLKYKHGSEDRTHEYIPAAVVREAV